MARPKLKEGEKGNYNTSKAVLARKKVTRQLNLRRKELAKVEKQKQNAIKKRDNVKNALDLIKKGGITEQEFIKTLPKEVKEAVESGVEITFKPNKGPQEQFLSAPEKEVLYGGAAGGGKSAAMLMDVLRYADNPNHRGLLLRRTLGELSELIDQSRKLYPKAFNGAVYKESKNLWIFPSKATIQLSYVDKDSDVIRFQGQSYTWIGIDELGHYPTPYVWNYLRSRLRTTDPTIQTYMRSSANPGGAGGWWIKKMFIDPAPAGEPFWATNEETGKILINPTTNKPLFQRRFIPARLTDNPYLTATGEYEAMLLSLPEVERRRLLDGDWDVAEGAAFSEFNRADHVVDPFDMPTNWTRIRAADYGYASPSCVLWGAVDWDNNLWIYRELYAKGLTGEALAQAVMEAERNDPPMMISVLDGACWSKHGTGPSIAETMIRNGVRWIPADKNRVSGKIEVHRRLQKNDYDEPRLRIFSTCTNLVRTLPTLPIAKTNSEDVDTHAEDHAYDALRYMVMTRQTNLPRYTQFSSDLTKKYKPVDEVFGY